MWYMVSQQQQRFFTQPVYTARIHSPYTQPVYTARIYIPWYTDLHIYIYGIYMVYGFTATAEIFFHTSPYISHNNRFVYIFLCRFYYCKKI